MHKIIASTALSAFMLAGCGDLFYRYETYLLPSINVSGTTYEVFMRARSNNLNNYQDPRTDPDATRAVYVIIRDRLVIDCGRTADPCASLVRRFNAGETDLVVRMDEARVSPPPERRLRPVPSETPRDGM